MKLHTDVVNRLQMVLNKLQVIAALRYQRPLRSGLVCLCSLVSMIFGATANAQSCYIWADTSGSQCTGQTAASVGACIVAYGMAEDRMYNDGASQRTYTGTACVDPPGPNSVGCYDQFNEYYPPNGTGGPYQELLLPDQVSGTQCPQYYIAATPVQRSETCSANCPADPINPGIGNVILTEEDVKFRGAGTIAYRRYYNSADQTGMDFVVGWRHSYDRSIQTIYQPLGTPYPGQSSLVSPGYPTPALACTLGFGTISGAVSSWTSATAIFSGGVCTISSSSTAIATVPIEVYPTPTPPTSAIEYDVVRDDGQIFRFTLQGGSIVNPPGISLRLVTNGSGFTLTDDDDTVEVYNTAGVLQSITTRAGVAQTVTYDSNGLFYKVVDSFGNSLTVARNNASNIGSISLSGGGSVLYSPDSNYRLGSVTNLDGTTRSYGYQPSGTGSFFNELTSLVDESATTYSSWIYDSQERATSTHEAGGANLTSLIYNGDSSDSVTVKDALGAVRTFSYSRVGDINKVTGISGSQCPTCEESAATTYDSYGWVASRTDYNGNLTCYQNDPVRGLELYRAEGFASGSTCPATLSSYTPVSGTLQRKISTVWSTTWREPLSITEPNRTTTFSNPDAHGNFQTKTITDTSVSPNVARIWRYTYTGYGQVLTVIGPRTDLVDKTTYTYWTCSTGYQCGQVETIQNSVGQVTTFNSYNAYGEPLTVTDPNGVVTTLTYDKRERLTTITVGTGASAEETQYSYWPTGLLETVTLPDLSTITYTYDGAHRLTTITDTLGNYIQYTLDAMGNPTETQSFDPSGTVHRTHYRTFTQLSELYTDVLAANTAAVTTTYTYDAQGNLTNIAAPLSRTTVNTPDALNRLSQIKDPASGITKIGYDANDNVASVVDPRTFTTSYIHNGFNQVTKLVSPDTGTSSTTYDSGGNVSTTTDARSALATYSYDALNRETKVVYSDQTINYTYDSGTNGKGRLTGASDANHTMAWTYDPQGRVNGKSQIVASITKSIGYTYTNADLITLTTPSGQIITYGYTNHRITSIKVGSTTLLSGVTYDPLGPATGWTWGNGATSSRSFDQDGNPSSIVTAGTTNAYTPDYAGRITQITDSTLSSNTWNFSSYDTLDRIKTASSSAKSRSYTYDANGNRLTAGGSTPVTLNISSTNNQITTTTGDLTRTYSYDAAGNASYTGETLTFNDRGRMSVAVSSGGTTNYVYNALGQLIEKSGNGGTTLLMYDEAGHILGEYSSTGALIQETIWIDDLPVATLRPSGSTVAIYYVHANHLGEPVKVTRPSDNGLMWRWDPDTFGSSTSSPNQNPAGLGTFVYNLRFPGHYALPESGLNYNYFRDYDPATGRYVESDPIGLRGGSYSTYSYVNNNPISNKDPMGLMCTPGVGCYTTPAEAAAAQSGNYLGYYQLACAGGDAYACFAEHVAANDSYLGQKATNRLRDALREKGCDNDATLNDIRNDLANAYASYLPDNPDNAIWPDAQAIAQFHWDVFGQYGLPPNTFGGTFLGSWGGLFGASIWCPNCGGPRPLGAGMH